MSSHDECKTKLSGFCLCKVLNVVDRHLRANVTTLQKAQVFSSQLKSSFAKKEHVDMLYSKHIPLKGCINSISFRFRSKINRLEGTVKCIDNGYDT